MQSASLRGLEGTASAVSPLHTPTCAGVISSSSLSSTIINGSSTLTYQPNSLPMKTGPGTRNDRERGKRVFGDRVWRSNHKDEGPALLKADEKIWSSRLHVPSVFQRRSLSRVTPPAISGPFVAPIDKSALITEANLHYVEAIKRFTFYTNPLAGSDAVRERLERQWRESAMEWSRVVRELEGHVTVKRYPELDAEVKYRIEQDEKIDPTERPLVPKSSNSHTTFFSLSHKRQRRVSVGSVGSVASSYHNLSDTELE